MRANPTRQPRRTSIAPVLALAVLIASVLGTPASSADPPGGLAAGWHRLSIDAGGLERWFRAFVPRRDMAGAPVVLLLHGGGRGMDKLFSKRAGAALAWPELAARERVLLLAPNGVDPLTGSTEGGRQNWNDALGGGSGPDDVGFLLALLRWAHATFRTDAGRVYITGASNGGTMTYRMLMAHPGVFAAGAAFIANLPRTPPPSRAPARPVPLMIVNGTKDPLMRFDGGGLLLGLGSSLSAEATAHWWADVNRARRDRATTSELPDLDPTDGCRVRLTRFPPAGPEGAPVHLYAMVGGGHVMPSRKHAFPERWTVRWVIGPRCRDVEAAEIAWNFFRRFRR